MALSNSILSYTDVRAVADEAIKRRGLRFTPQKNTHGAAINWMHRFNKFRLLARKQGQYTWDILSIAVEDREVVLTYDSYIKGSIKTLSGEEILAPETERVDDLLIAAKLLKQELDEDG